MNNHSRVGLFATRINHPVSTMKEKVSEDQPRKQGGGGRRRERSKSFVQKPTTSGRSLLGYHKNKGNNESSVITSKAIRQNPIEEKKEDLDITTAVSGPKSLFRSSSLSKLDAAKRSPVAKKSTLSSLFSRKPHARKEKENNHMGSDSSLPPLSPTKSPSGGSKGRMSARSGDLMTVRNPHETLSSNAQLMLQHLAATQGPSKKNQASSSKSKKYHDKNTTGDRFSAGSLDEEEYLSPERTLTKSSLQQQQYLQSRYRKASVDAIKPIDLQ